MTQEQRDNVELLAKTLSKTSEQIFQYISDNPDIDGSIVLIHANGQEGCMVSAICKDTVEQVTHLLTSWADGDKSACAAIIMAATRLAADIAPRKLET